MLTWSLVTVSLITVGDRRLIKYKYDGVELFSVPLPVAREIAAQTDKLLKQAEVAEAKARERE